MSAEILVLFSCGHTRDFHREVSEEAVCPVCGNRQIMRVTAPAPRITLGGVSVLPVPVKERPRE